MGVPGKAGGPVGGSVAGAPSVGARNPTRPTRPPRRGGMVVNRWFAAAEGDIQGLARWLDRDVAVVDPREAERGIGRMVQNKPDTAEPLDRFIRGLSRGEDDPLVEDLPLYPAGGSPICRSSPPSWHFARSGRWSTGTATLRCPWVRPSGWPSPKGIAGNDCPMWQSPGCRASGSPNG